MKIGSPIEALHASLSSAQYVDMPEVTDKKRRTVKHHLTKDRDYDSMVLPDKERFGNEWNAPKDGKHYWKDDEDKWRRK